MFSGMRVRRTGRNVKIFPHEAWAQALRLPIRAQNNTKVDFTTAAVEMRGYTPRSETCVRMSAERAKIFSE